MVPDEILEEIFAYLSRDDLDHCEIICLTWSKLIETSKQLKQRRVVSLRYRYYDDDDRNSPFWIELKSPTGQTILLEEYDPTQELPAFRVFKNTIIDALYVFPNRQNNFLEEKETWAKVFTMAGDQIKVKSVHTIDANAIKLNTIIKLKHFHDLLPKYIDAEELTISVNTLSNKFLFDEESWKYLDFGKKTELNINYHNFCYFSIDTINTFKGFISGRYMEHPKLNELVIYLMNLSEINIRAFLSSFTEAFCNTTEPQNFFKIIRAFCNVSFDEIDGVCGFVRNDLDPQKYRLSHPIMNWELEATRAPYKELRFKTIEI